MVVLSPLGSKRGATVGFGRCEGEWMNVDEIIFDRENNWNWHVAKIVKTRLQARRARAGEQSLTAELWRQTSPHTICTSYFHYGSAKIILIVEENEMRDDT